MLFCNVLFLYLFCNVLFLCLFCNVFLIAFVLGVGVLTADGQMVVDKLRPLILSFLLFILQAFAIFCGMGIYNTQMYETAIRASAKQRVALEVLSYHVSAPSEDTSRLKVWCYCITSNNINNIGML